MNNEEARKAKKVHTKEINWIIKAVFFYNCTPQYYRHTNSNGHFVLRIVLMVVFNISEIKIM